MTVHSFVIGMFAHPIYTFMPMKKIVLAKNKIDSDLFSHQMLSHL